MSDNQRIIEKYNKRIDEHGISIQALAGGVESRRQIRFETLYQCGIEKGNSILDIGCGFGDFYDFLNKNLGKGNFKYCGVDINPRLIEHAQKIHKGATFLVADILNEEINGGFDYVVSSQAFNLKLYDIDNYSFVTKMLRKSYDIANKGVAIDFLTEYVDYKLDENEFFYYSPEKIFSIAKSITKRVVLKHDMPVFDFCIYLYKDFDGWNM
ncbi:MAG: class I SAM-dependent methyltransferase [Bacteroidetes bacterium]|nr:class I SAM-dependent methyltransferase [Bacteroidota bacterium]